MKLDKSLRLGKRCTSGKATNQQLVIRKRTTRKNVQKTLRPLATKFQEIIVIPKLSARPSKSPNSPSVSFL